ncbi:transcriptional regulator family: Fungal Specific TF [Paecilomyces variotii]|nr:transcriptional regulator family: Fungal Specific TF [Paecilomyces variotii]
MPPLGRGKRSKIRLACTNCREDKTRCDGKRPICTRCRKRRGPVTCVYKRPASLTRRVSSPEPADQLQQRESNRRPDNAHSEYLASSRRNERRVFDESQALPEIVHQPAFPTLSNGKQDVQTRDALATVPLGEDTDALYGGSSTIALLRHVAPGVHSQPTRSESNDETYTNESQRSHLRSPSFTTYPEVIRQKDKTVAIYPQRQTADDFVRCFFEFVHPLFPVLHRPSFEAQYESMWWPPDDHSKSREEISIEEDSVFSTILNLVFALGCQYSSLVPLVRRSSLADEFYQRSRKLLVVEILDTTSLPLVQLLLLQGIYLQSSMYPTRCWNVIGLAIRAAQSLGLHLDVESKTQLSREMRRRVWHVCVCLDRLLAMSFGRPTMIGKSWNVPIPSLIDDEYLFDNGEEGVQPAHIPSRMGLFVWSCPLFEILAEILGYFYIDDGGDGYPKHLGSEACNKELLSRVLDFNRRLDNLFDSIPEYLKTTKITRPTISDKNSSVSLQQQVLYCRFLYVRVLSLRPLLLLARRREQPSSSTRLPAKGHLSLDEELIVRCCNLCVVTAHQIIESIYEHLDTAYKSSGWHSVYFTFASITILLAGLQCPYVDMDVGDDSFEAGWNRCLSILEHYKDQIHSATQAIHVLRILRSRIFRRETQGGTPEAAISAHNGGPGLLLADSIQSPQIPPALDISDQFDLTSFNPHGAEFIADAWFGQQITNLDLFFPS